MRTREKERASRRNASEVRFIPLGSGFFLDRETAHVIAL
jgi:hypothetical protein